MISQQDRFPMKEIRVGIVDEYDFMKDNFVCFASYQTY